MVYQALTISSAAEVNDDVVYKVIDQGHFTKWLSSKQ